MKRMKEYTWQLQLKFQLSWIELKVELKWVDKSKTQNPIICPSGGYFIWVKFARQKDDCCNFDFQIELN